MQLIQTPEDEMHDFKREWYKSTKTSELIKDIFSFVNTSHHDDCYLIIGVTDDQDCVGVLEDENRKNQQMVIDTLRQCPISGGVIPKISVDTYTVDEKEIDVITIYDTDELPVFLSQDYPKNPKGNKIIHAGQIFTRNKDVNTGIVSTASFGQTEVLWKKRMGLDLPIKQRYGRVLSEVQNWEYFENRRNECGYVYTVDPDFVIMLEDMDEDRDELMAFSLNLFRKRINTCHIDLMFRNVLVDSFNGVFLDSRNALVVMPDMGFVEGMGEPLTGQSYYYYLKSNLNYKLQMMIQKVPHGIAGGCEQLRPFYESVVLYNEESEKEEIEHNILAKEPSIEEEIDVSEDDIKKQIDAMWADFSEEDDALKPSNIEGMLRQLKTAQFINQYLSSTRD
ncbi:helix-turn-helix domain-containing protein [Weissella uvarum]|uniref:AlbA family DNA-binding domain-containing protein n=1 Tax=Weissella uvarum TaxID=1479233 RepID=UPI001960868E|nr:ATP-binding protein [Weissella uvarum]MCM0596085.1 ATP-binding protein [Weissella uvarum]